MMSLLRDRYLQVWEERQAYQAIQMESTRAIEAQSLQRRQLELEKGYLLDELERTRNQVAQGRSAMQEVLAMLGLAANEMSELLSGEEADVSRLRKAVPLHLQALHDDYIERLQQAEQVSSCWL